MAGVLYAAAFCRFVRRKEASSPAALNQLRTLVSGHWPWPGGVTLSESPRLCRQDLRRGLSPPSPALTIT